MRELPLFLLLVGINLLILIGQIQGLSIGYHEAKILYGEFSPLQQIITLSLHLFGQNDYALRAPMIVLHLFSVFLLYAISKFYVSGKNDRIWIVLIYMLLPGVTSAALIVDNAGLMIALVFLFAYGYLRFGRYALALFP
ncbi:MAG: glycosyltransferase family 39 protein, partial [Sulfuricurvum sp.]|nr:glycosyltransferase family 39 protein [Sulfuricurvum sp.]